MENAEFVASVETTSSPAIKLVPIYVAAFVAGVIGTAIFLKKRAEKNSKATEEELWTEAEEAAQN